MASLVEQMKEMIANKPEAERLKPRGADDSGNLAWRIQVEGDPESGKTHAILSIPALYIEILKVPPEKCLVCVIDMDQGGVDELLAAGTFPDDYQGCVIYLQVHNIWEAYEAYDVFKKILAEHKEKNGVLGWMCFENMGKLWESSQTEYCVDVYGKPLHVLKKERMCDAKAKGKKMMPLFDRKLEWPVVNAIHDGLAWDISEGRDFHMLWTCHLKDNYVTEKNDDGYDETKVVGRIGTGKKGASPIEARVRFIVRTYLDGNKFKARVTKSRGTRTVNYTFEIKDGSTLASFFKAVCVVKESEIKKQGFGKNFVEKWVRPWTEADYDGRGEGNVETNGTH